MPQVELHDTLLLAYSTVADGNMDERFSDRSLVMQNRRRFFHPYGINARTTIEGKQIHSDRVLLLDSENTKMWYGANIPGVDGFVTCQPDSAILLKLADCVPVVLYCPEKKLIGIVHAGLKGAVKNIHTKALQIMIDKFDADPSDVLVWLGPSAKACHYQTSDFDPSANPAWFNYIKPNGDKYYIDIPTYIKDSLHENGVKIKNITIDKTCTIEDESLFSHQRSTTKSESEGRFLVAVQLK